MRARTNLVKSAATLVSFLILLLLAQGSSLDKAVAQETKQQSPPGAPKLNAGSWALIDADTGLYLAGKDPDKRVPIASTTKIMLALVALDEGVGLDKEITISKRAVQQYGFGSPYSNAGLNAGERLTVRDALTAALIPSATEVAYALAEYLGDGSADQTVQKMNEKAKSMGLKNTHFENPVGVDERGHYSSASDLAEIARAAMKYPEFREIVNKPQATISTQSRKIDLVTTNLLILPNSGYEYAPANGVKTGTSIGAGPCVVASAESGDESYIAVVLHAAGDTQRFEAARTALEYGFGKYAHEPLIKKGDAFGEVPLPYRRGESVKLVAAKSVSGLTGPGLEVERSPTHEKAPPAAKTGRKLGTVEVSVDGHDVGSSPLVVKKGYEEASVWQKVKYWAGDLKRWIMSR